MPNLRTRLSVVLLVSAMLVAFAGTPGFTVHAIGLFELDGDATDSAAVGDDWSSVFSTTGANIAEEFTRDWGAPTDTTYLSTGKSKDIEDFDEWVVTTTDEAPDKDELMNAFAAAYVEDGDLIVYFGADRFDASGDAQIGFWFTQDDVSIAGSSMQGTHREGDVLILSHFVNGGSVPKIDVYEWVGSGGSDGPIDKISGADTADCAAAAADDLRCAIVSAPVTGETTPAPWDFENKSGDSDYLAGEFYEGGVNLTDLGVSTNCFSTFIAETRTSQSTDARLKDVALGDFDTCATKKGTKFEDSNADGDRDAGEPVLEGWQIHLFGDHDVHRHETTDANGNYEFADLEPGDYTVCETQQTGWSQSMPGTGAGTADCSAHTHAGTPAGRGYAISLSYGDVDAGNDFGNFRTASKSGTKFLDANGDGDRDDDEVGLEGWTIYADLNNNGSLDDGEPFDVTDEDGSYSITGLQPGTYTFREVLTEGWTCSYPTPCSWTVTLSSGEQDTGNDFGNWQPADTSGVKFEDDNADGDRDAGEDGMSGWIIYVDYDGDATLDDDEPFDVTDEDGTYEITGIRAGTYKVREVQQDGWTCSMPNPCYYEETFTSGASLTGNEFGNWHSAGRGGVKFEDLDADGSRDSGEPGLSGWTIYVDYNDNGVLDSDEPFAVTGDNGAYLITGVNAGTYKVREVQQDGWTCAMPNPCYYEQTFTSGGSSTGADFGNFRNATVGGSKFNDVDGDGVRDEGEPSLEGIEIHLFGVDGAGDAVHEHQVTDANGAYSFAVAPGDYTVCETVGDAGSPEVSVTKSASPESGTPGTVISYTYVVSNTGDVPLMDVVVTDDVLGVVGTIASLAAGSSRTIVREDAVTLEATALSDGVSVTASAGYVQTFPAAGADCSQHGGGVGYSVAATSGSVDGDSDFGNVLSTVEDSDVAFVTVVLPLVIPKTGTDTRALADLGFTLLAVGVALVGFTRRRRGAID